MGIEYYSTDPVHHVRWSPDGSMLAAGGQIYVFDDFNFNGPKIQISTPQSKSSYTSSLVEIAGKISGLHGVRSATVSVNGGAPAALSLAPDGFFARTVFSGRWSKSNFNPGAEQDKKQILLYPWLLIV